jgi:anti-anti-sigma regulatory factor
MRSPGLQAAVTAEGVVHLAISGDLDVSVVAALADELAWLAEVRPARLIVDMSG